MSKSWKQKAGRVGSCGVGALVVLAAAFPAHGATFVVDDVSDTADAGPGDGSCADAAGSCSLRAAVMETNALAGPDEIRVPAGIYVLAIPGIEEDGGLTGDLDVLDDLVVAGDGAGRTVVDAAGLDRVFHALGVVDVTLTALTMRGGYVTDPHVTPAHGGCVFQYGYPGGATLSITDAVISGCTVTGNYNNRGGGVGALSGYVHIADSSIVGNRTGMGTTDHGGGLYIAGEGGLIERTVFRRNFSRAGGGFSSNATSGPTTVTDCTFTDNVASAEGGGIEKYIGTLEISGSTFTRNSARSGGGIWSYQNDTWIVNSTFSGNTAETGGGIVSTGSGTVDLQSVTITRNVSTADAQTGGISAGTNLSLANTILAGNAPAPARPTARAPSPPWGTTWWATPGAPSPTATASVRPGTSSAAPAPSSPPTSSRWRTTAGPPAPTRCAPAAPPSTPGTTRCARPSTRGAPPDPPTATATAPPAATSAPTSADPPRPTHPSRIPSSRARARARARLSRASVHLDSRPDDTPVRAHAQTGHPVRAPCRHPPPCRRPRRFPGPRYRRSAR